MSGTVGGASFELSVRREQYRQQLGEARREAQQAAEDIRRALAGGGAPAPSAAPALQQQSQGLQRVARDATAASKQIADLNQATTLAGAEAQKVAAQYRQLGQAQAQAANAGASAAQQLQRALVPTSQIADAQVRAYVAAQQGVRDYSRELLTAQRALNDFNASAARAQSVEQGRGGVLGGAGDVERAIAALREGNPSAALEAIERAAADARRALDEVGASLAELRRRATDATGLDVDTFDADRLRQLRDEVEGLRQQGFPTDVPELKPIRDEIAALEQLEKALQGQGDEFGQLNAQARSLTGALGNLQRAQQQLTEEARKQAAAEDAAADKAAKALEERLRLQERAAQASGAVRADPTLAARPDTIAALQQTGLSAAEARKAVDGLQSSLNAINRIRANTDVAEGMAGTAAAARSADTALDSFARGDRLAGIQAQERTLQHLREALNEVNLSARRLGDSLIGLAAPERNAALQPLVQRATQLQTAISRAESSIAASRAPELKAEADAAREAERTIKRANDEIARSRRESFRRSTLFSAVQDIGYSTGAGQVGELFAGIGRASELMGEKLGIGTAAAIGLTGALVGLAAAAGAAVIAGAGFNAFLDDAGVRLEYATGSAEGAREAIDHLVAAGTGRQLSAFSFEDLEQGMSLIRRFGLEAEGTEKRIADAAVVSGKSFSDTATQIASFYDLIRNNEPFGDQARSLQRAGILTAEWTNRLVAAQAEGASAAELTELMNEALDQYSGAAEKAANTASGSFRRIGNELKALSGALTESAFKDLGSAVGELADALGDPRIRDGARVLGQISQYLFAPTAGLALGQRIRESLGIGAAAVTERRLVDQGPANEELFGRTRAALEAGRSAVNAFAEGFDSGSREAFADIAQTVERHMTAVAGGELTAAMQENLHGVINPLLAELVDEIQRTGEVSEGTATRVRAALGDQADRVLELADAYAELRGATEDATAAQLALNAAQRNLDVTQQTRAGILAIDQQAIDDAEAVAAKHREEAADQIERLRDQIDATKGLAEAIDAPLAKIADGLEATIAAMERANRDAAQAAQDAIQGRRDALDEYQAGVDERRRQAQAEIDALAERVQQINEEADRAREAATQHQDAFNAVINGTVDLFNQVNRQQDEITRKIIAKWEAEIGGARRARAEAQQRVDQNELQNLELQLQYNRRIQAAREAGREAEARALERERDRVLNRRRQQQQVERDEAELARRKEQQAIAEARQAAAQQGATDQAGVQDIESRADVAEAELKAARALEEQRQAAEEEEIRRRQAEIEHLERVERDRARAAQADIQAKRDELDRINTVREANRKRFDDIVDGYQAEIDNIDRAQKAQEKKDRQAIADAKLVYEADKKFWDARVVADQKAVDDARAIKDLADDRVTLANDELTSLREINKTLDDQITKEKEILRIRRERLGLPPEPREGPTTPTSSGPQGTPANQPNPGESAPPPVNLPPLLPWEPGDPPSGYHTEKELRTNIFWFVPDGFHLEDYGKRRDTSIDDPATGYGGPGQPYALRGAGAATYAYAGGGAIYEHIVGVGQTTGARYEFGERGVEYVVPAYDLAGAGAGAGGRAVNGPLVSIGQVNASDPVDVDRLLRRMQEVMAVSGLAALDTAQRGGIVRGRPRR